MKSKHVVCFTLCLLLLAGCGANKETRTSAIPSVVAVAQAENGKYGFIDKTGQWAIQPVFDKAEQFSEGLAAVKQNGFWGYIDRTGQFAIKPEFYSAMRFSEGMAAVYLPSGKNTEEWFIDKTGNRKFKLDLAFGDWYTDFHGGLLRVYKGGKFGFLDKDGNTAIDFVYAQAGDFIDGRALVASDKSMGYIRPDGSELVPVQYAFVTAFSDGLVSAIMKNGTKYESTVFDEQGAPVYRFNGTITALNHGYAEIVEKIGLSSGWYFNNSALLDQNGKAIFDPQKMSSVFVGDVIRVEDIVISEDGKDRDYVNARFLDLDGNLLFSDSDLQKGLPFLFNKDFDSVYVNKVHNGFVLAELTDNLTEDKSVPNKDQKTDSYYAVYDLKGNLILTTTAIHNAYYTYFYEDDTLCGWNDKEKAFVFVDKNGTATMRKPDNSTIEYHYSLWAVSENGKWGYLNPKGQYAISPQFLWAGAFHTVGRGDGTCRPPSGGMN